MGVAFSSGYCLKMPSFSHNETNDDDALSLWIDITSYEALVPCRDFACPDAKARCLRRQVQPDLQDRSMRTTDKHQRKVNEA